VVEAGVRADDLAGKAEQGAVGEVLGGHRLGLGGDNARVVVAVEYGPLPT
jgi:hypothetical protein